MGFKYLHTAIPMIALRRKKTALKDRLQNEESGSFTVIY